MDFMKWLNSLGDLLYEVMSWLIFYPITLWRTIATPLQTMEYAGKELDDAEDGQFTARSIRRFSSSCRCC